MGLCIQISMVCISKMEGSTFSNIYISEQSILKHWSWCGQSVGIYEFCEKQVYIWMFLFNVNSLEAHQECLQKEQYATYHIK